MIVIVGCFRPVLIDDIDRVLQGGIEKLHREEDASGEKEEHPFDECKIIEKADEKNGAISQSKEPEAAFGFDGRNEAMTRVAEALPEFQH